MNATPKMTAQEFLDTFGFVDFDEATDFIHDVEQIINLETLGVVVRMAQIIARGNNKVKPIKNGPIVENPNPARPLGTLEDKGLCYRSGCLRRAEYQVGGEYLCELHAAEPSEKTVRKSKSPDRLCDATNCFELATHVRNQTDGAKVWLCDDHYEEW